MLESVHFTDTELTFLRRKTLLTWRAYLPVFSGRGSQCILHHSIKLFPSVSERTAACFSLQQFQHAVTSALNLSQPTAPVQKQAISHQSKPNLFLLFLNNDAKMHKRDAKHKFLFMQTCFRAGSNTGCSFISFMIGADCYLEHIFSAWFQVWSVWNVIEFNQVRQD